MIKSRLSLHLLYVMHNQKCVLGVGRSKVAVGSLFHTVLQGSRLIPCTTHNFRSQSRDQSPLAGEEREKEG